MLLFKAAETPPKYEDVYDASNRGIDGGDFINSGFSREEPPPDYSFAISQVNIFLEEKVY